jgi:hypothetical protein
MDIPPDTSMRCALTQRLSSDSSDAIIGPMSLGSPTRRPQLFRKACFSVSTKSSNSVSARSRRLPRMKMVGAALEFSPGNGYRDQGDHA